MQPKRSTSALTPFEQKLPDTKHKVEVHWCEGAAKTLWCLPEIGGRTSRGSARGSSAYANSPGNVSLHAHGGWTACRRCRSWKSAHLSGWSDASWVCDGAWRCSYSGGTWAYWGLGVRTRLRREKNRKHADAQEGQQETTFCSRKRKLL